MDHVAATSSGRYAEPTMLAGIRHAQEAPLPLLPLVTVQLPVQLPHAYAGKVAHCLGGTAGCEHTT